MQPRVTSAMAWAYAVLASSMLSGCLGVTSAPQRPPTAIVAVAEAPSADVVMPYGDSGRPAVGGDHTPGAATNPAPTAAPATAAPPSATPDLPVEPGGRSDAATALDAQPDCDSEGYAVARLRWAPAAQAGLEQRVDLAVRQDGFDIGQFASSPSLPAGQADHTWSGGIAPGILHVWRVLTRQGGHWSASEVGSFTGPLCGRDPVTPFAP